MTMNDKDEDKGGWVEIDLDELADAQQDADSDADDEEDDSEDEQEEVQTRKAQKEDEESPERKSRAQERIRQLVAARKQAEEEAAKYRQELETVKTGTNAVRKQSLTAQENLIDQQLESVKVALKRAIEDGDVESQLALSEKMQDLKVDKRILSAQANKIQDTSDVEDKKTNTTTTTARRVTNEDIPEEMKYWIAENKWFLNPETREERKKQRLVMQIGDDLVKDGYTEYEPDFYDELEKRLKKSFAKSGEDDVVLDKETTSSSTRRTSKPAVQVSGASRAPVTNRKTGRVALTPEERQIARRLNLSEQEYALNKVKREKSDNGWTTI